MEPHELGDLATNCRLAWEALGKVNYGMASSEVPSLVFRRSLYVVADVEAGEAITEKNVRVIRPGHGLAPKYLPEILGKKAARAIARGTPLKWADLGSGSQTC
jgi:N-acetylneuraminate synthase